MTSFWHVPSDKYDGEIKWWEMWCRVLVCTESSRDEEHVLLEEKRGDRVSRSLPQGAEPARPEKRLQLSYQQYSESQKVWGNRLGMYVLDDRGEGKQWAFENHSSLLQDRMLWRNLSWGLIWSDGSLKSKYRRQWKREGDQWQPVQQSDGKRQLGSVNLLE